MSISLDMILIIVGIFGILVLGVVLLIRGGKASWSKDGITVDVGGDIMRNDKGSVFLEVAVAERIGEKLGTIKAEIKALKPSITARALEYGENKLYVMLHIIEESILNHLNFDDPVHLAHANGIANAIEAVQARLMSKIIKPSWINNGFYEFRTLTDNGPADTRDFTDFVKDKEYTILSEVRHFIRSRFPRDVIDYVLRDFETQQVKDQIHSTVTDIYEKFWSLQHTEKTAAGELEKRWYDITRKMREGKIVV